ncbi:tetratricopeptide repeat protein [Fontivita pretiosa]|uniref:TlpA family protein disulfide reductase n=1 Tax=Fontivita pretiosa TaxID=2989684 RepID=UPI003D16B0F0
MRYAKAMRLMIAFAVVFTGVASVAAAGGVINWSTKDINGAEVRLPSGQTTILVFVRADQEQSAQAMQQIQKAAGDAKVIVILSGPRAEENARSMAAAWPATWLFAADPDFSASGKMNIHVWPTTLVLKADGTEVAHLAGMPKSFAADLQAYLDFANGKLDDAALKQRLSTRELVADSPAQIAARHLQVAQRLIARGAVEQAQRELNEGLKHAPQDPALQLLLARVLVMLDRPQEAIQILDRLTPGGVPAWQPIVLRARALIAMEKWSEAKAILPDALKLNPDPAEAHYLLGLCLQHEQQWQQAAEHFRQAYESATSSGIKSAGK